MRNVMKGLAILALLLTIAAAGAVLYALNTLTPEVVSVSTQHTPAAQAQDRFDEIMTQIEEGSFVGKLYASDVQPATAECEFVTYTVRLKNKGFFPAEWIAMTVAPAEGDILQLGDTGAYVLNANSMGDLSATILTTKTNESIARMLTIECYVFGRKVSFSVQAQE